MATYSNAVPTWQQKWTIMRCLEWQHRRRRQLKEWGRPVPAAAGKSTDCRLSLPLNGALPCRLLWEVGRSCRGWAGCALPAGRGGSGGSSAATAMWAAEAAGIHRSRKSLRTSSLWQNSFSDKPASRVVSCCCSG